MAKTIYDVIVIGTGAGGGMAIKTLCEAGLKVCALNAGRRLDPEKDFRYHRMPWDMKFRGLDDPKRRGESYGYMDNEYTKAAWEHEIPFTTPPGKKWMWPRCKGVGGKTNFWGRSSARFGEIDFRAASLDGYDVDWPLTYDEISPFYTRVEKMIGVASTVQSRPSNPDGSYLPPFNFRCLDYILEAGCNKIGVPYLPDRCAQLTVPHEGHPACHYCGECTTGCDVGAFFSTPYFFLPKAEATKNLELRTDALAKNVLVDENGHASGVAYNDRKTKQEVEVYGRAVVVAAGCIESSRIMLNSKSRHWPDGIANSSGQLGRNLCDHLYGEPARGYLPQLLGQPSFPDHVADSTIAWMPRWQNLKNPHEEKFIRGYSVYPDGGCVEFPWYANRLDGFGSSFKREVKRRYPTPVSFEIQAPTLRLDSNYVDLDPEVKDPYGTPVARIHFDWDENVLLMWEHSKQVCEEVIRAAGGVYEGASDEPEIPGFSLHETGTCRMGNDPKKFVTNRFGQTHDVPNLYVCDASVFLNCTDKTTTISIMAFTLRTSEHLIENFRRGEHKAARGQCFGQKQIYSSFLRPRDRICGKSMSMRKAIHHLKKSDPVLRKIIEKVGPCRMEFGPPEFHSLAEAIVYQQLNGKAAVTIFKRFAALAGEPLTPAGILKLSDEQLRSVGLSKQKSGYIKDLAAKTRDGSLDFARLAALPDEEVIKHLTQVKGVGVWTAQMFLMFTLQRPDVLPTGDYGIQAAIKKHYHKRKMPKPKDMEKIARSWAPYRSIACWYLWKSMDIKTL